MVISVLNKRRPLGCRTHSEKSDQPLIPHKVFMRLAALEIERSRHGKEKDNMLSRIKTIDARVADIDGEKATLLAGMEAQISRKSDGRRPASPCGGGFRIKY